MNTTITSATAQNIMSTSKLCASGAIIAGRKYAAWLPSQESLLEPLSWRKQRHVELRCDLFHENVTDEMRDKIFAVMALCPQHTFQVLTKRPERMLTYLTPSVETYQPAKIFDAADDIGHMYGMRRLREVARERVVWPLPNVQLGVSVEDQKSANERIPVLLRTPAAVRFISAEPLLGPIDLNELPRPFEFHRSPYGWTSWLFQRLHWVIVGGESGPGARPMHPDWARGLRDQCEAAGVPFFFKQWGEWIPWEPDGGFSEWKSQAGRLMDRHGFPDFKDADVRGWTAACFHDGAEMCVHQRVGTKAAGHLLDGVEHHAFPAVSE